MINTELKSNVFKVKISQGNYYICLPNHNVDYIQGVIASKCMPYEYDMLLSMLGFLKPGDIVLDVGANVGNHTLFLASIAKANVVAFEPNPELANAIRESLEINALGSQVTVKQIGLGKEETVGSFNESIPDNLGAQSISLGGGSLQINTLDSMPFKGTISLIKIDVEGMELDVLKGAKNTLIKDKPTLYVEASALEEFLAIESFLTEIGYVVLDSFNATPTHLFIHNSKLDADLLERFNKEKTKKYVYLQSQELKEVKEKLDQANIKYRNITAVVDRLKEKISSTESAKLETSHVNDVLPVLKELEQHQQTTADFQEKLFNQSVDLVVCLEKLSEQIAQEKKQLEQKLAKLQTENSALIERLGRNESLHEKVEKEADNLRKSLEDKLIDLAQQSALYEKSESEKSALENKLLSQSNELLEAIARLSKKEALYEQSENERSALESKLSNQSNELLETIACLSKKEALYEQIESEKSVLESKLSNLSNELLDTVGRLSEQEALCEKNDIKREELLTKVGLLEAKITEMESNKIPQLEKDGASAQQEIAALKEELNKAKKAANNAEIAKLKAFSQVDELRASVMFQLGYALVSSCLSLRDFVALPVRLASIVKQGVIKLVNSKKTEHKSDELTTSAVASSKLIKQNSPKLQLPAKLVSNGVEEHIKGLTSDRKVACVMDEFTFSSYESTCNLQQLTPEGWKNELESFQPELLFIESAWRGKEELWGSKVGHNSQELQDIVKWCKAKQIPTLFWNKEDPIHFQTFLNVAQQFDYVFTTDLDCVSRYKAMLKHNQVYFLPFACQPLSHNPIEKFSRKDSISFAGAYYKKYPERTKDLESFVSTLPDIKPLEIFDRNYGKNDENYMFPDTYHPFIVGTLPFDKIDVAYKGYKYAINLNSIKQSQTMFARRVYELLASNTITISNFSKGVRLMFGDLVICSDSGVVIKEHLIKCEQDRDYADKFRLAGLRKALSEHTYQQRFSYIQEKVFGSKADNGAIEVAVLSFVDSFTEAVKVVNSFEKQVFENKSLVLVCKNITNEIKGLGRENVKVVPAKNTCNMVLRKLFERATHLATFHSADYYGRNFIKDMLLHYNYLDVDVIGKSDSYEYRKNEVQRNNEGRAYQIVDGLYAHSSIVRFKVIERIEIKKWKKLSAKPLEKQFVQFSVDRFNYCKNGNDQKGVEDVVDDISNIDIGCSVSELQSIAENATPMAGNAVESVLDLPCLATIFENVKANHIKLKARHNSLSLSSTLANGKHEYLYGNEPLSIDKFNPIVEQDEKLIKLFVDATPGLSTSFVLIYLDDNKQRLAHDIVNTNQNRTLHAPFACKYVKVGFRALSSGECEIKAIVLGERNLLPSKLVSSNKNLLITNNYPSYNDLYRNGFVHSRSKAYEQEGVGIDIFRFKAEAAISYHEFEGVDVVTGDESVLNKLLHDNDYKSISVHFLDEKIWAVLKEISTDVRVNIWVHGADIQPWWRRKCLYNTDLEMTIAQKKTELKLNFWKQVFTSNSNLHFVFVSNYLAQSAMEDVGVRLSEENYSIIPNGINTELFSFVEKPIEQRTKILSIRPYASKIYANDLAVKAVLELSKESFFNELEFKFIGNGVLFDETLEPLRQFANVTIEKRFLNQQEIANYHKDYGVFLCPSRMDTQGVSRDEAMASGLVPITNGVGAIPEYLSNSEGYVCKEEDYLELANAIIELYNSPKKFEEKSSCSAQRIREQRSHKAMCSQEIISAKLNV